MIEMFEPQSAIAPYAAAFSIWQVTSDVVAKSFPAISHDVAKKDGQYIPSNVKNNYFTITRRKKYYKILL
jgi:hypothetical protein